MHFATASAPHLPRTASVQRLMVEVLAALSPGLLALVWQFGPGVLWQCLIALAAAVSAEAIALLLRGRPLAPALGDGSAALTALLLALSIPPLSPWWLVALGTAFAILLGKHVYGGLGYNPFNPAMLGYAMLLVSFPRAMTAWLPPGGLGIEPFGLAETATAILGSGSPWDALAMATPLDLQKTGLARGLPLEDIHVGPLFGAIGARGWQWANFGFLLGGLWLLQRRRIAWQIPAGFLTALTLGSLLLVLAEPAAHATPLFQAFSGGTMLGAFFIATDPVTASTTPRGRWLYGLGIGLLVLVIRDYGGYPDGIAFAVLLLNLAAPTLDRYTRPPHDGAGR